MSLRCPHGRDAIVFGPCGECRPTPVDAAYARHLGYYLPADANQPEPRYMETLNEAERTGH